MTQAEIDFCIHLHNQAARREEQILRSFGER
jgi:hypothetical protein